VFNNVPHSNCCENWVRFPALERTDCSVALMVVCANGTRTNFNFNFIFIKNKKLNYNIIQLYMDLFSPLGKEYCAYFYILSVFGLVSFCMFLFGSILYGFQKKQDVGYYMHALMLSSTFIVAYFQNRLLYSMCV
jgi:hypothetical protein